ncbi:MAG: isoleucine--tRNA ligase [Proteobacteria bacterium]|nr:isoleucine--tRNA ligase [Pseudomonadota bacterium]
MDYKSTLNLPVTSFPMKANLTQNEPERLKKWKKLDIYNKMREERKGKRLFHLHDGPPYANGNIHIGHSVNKILKDIVVKYFFKEGYDTPYIPGWDCHGLPIELQAEKSIGKNKKEVTKLEIRKFCREYAKKYVKIQSDEFERLGVIGDWDNPYITMAYDYQANIVREFANFVKEGAVYRSKKPVYWCISCNTALAEAEVEYDDHTSPSVYVKFPVKSDISNFSNSLKGKEVSIIIWTTTPWTLPANRAIAVHPDYDYVFIETSTKEVFIIAKDLLEKFTEILPEKIKIITETKGENLKGLLCQHPFEDVDSIVLTADFVTLDTGTGCVHIAPGHGQEDYELGLKHNIEVYAPVDQEGKFHKSVKYFGGMKVFSANEEIIKKLKELGKLIASQSITHSYPHCWRCKEPVIFRAEEQWFVSMDKTSLRKIALSEIDKVKWIPSWGRDRIYNMIEGRPDWCISRQRSWGVPIIAFHCKSCDEYILDTKLIEKVADLFEKEGADIWFEKTADFFLGDYKCPKCGGKDFEKEEDILDVWFDSGVSFSYLKSKYGYEHPVDMYLEGSDQHRGWFHSSLLASCLAYKRAPYKSVLTHGFVVDAEGRKMSKSLGNVISPQDIISKYGAEILRIWVASEDYREDIRISQEILERLVDSYRRVRNTFKYMLGVLADFDSNKNYISYDELSYLDKAVLNRLYRLDKKVRKAYQNYEFHTVFHSIHNFCVKDLSSIYLDILKDRMYVLSPDDKKRRASQTVVFEITKTLALLLSPILSFTCDEVWEHFNLNNKKDSILLECFCELPKFFENDDIEKTFNSLLLVREDVQKALEDARRRKIIGHSLDAKVILYISDEIRDVISQYFEELREIFILSQIEIKFDGKGYYKGELSGISIDIFNADGKKCERCWVFDTTVGEDSSHPTICKRCRDVVSG